MGKTLRPDLKAIAGLIEEGARVLDIGCGEGALLHYLTEQKNVDGHGFDIDAKKVSEALSKGLSVVQGDADNDLKHYPNNAFDYVVLGETLQAMRQPKEVLKEILRVGKRAIISIPNFGYWKNRAYLGLKGKMPVTSTLSYQWYETPNIHFCTISDFVNLAGELNCTVEKRLCLSADGSVRPFSGNGPIANLFAEEGIFVLSK